MRAVVLAALVMLAGCGGSDDGGGGCVFTDTNGAVICDSIAENFDCATAVYDDATLTCRTTGCAYCSDDRCAYTLDDVPTRADCVDALIERACADSAFDADARTCRIGGCVVC